MHPRKAIRDAVVSALTTAGVAGGNVKPTRVVPVADLTLPAVGVFALSEQVDAESRDMAPRELTRDLELAIEVWVAETSTVPADDAIDTITELIEAAMDADRWFGDTCADSILKSTDIEVIETSDRMLGWASLTYEITYRATIPAVDVTLDDFQTVATDYNLENEVEVADQANDLFTVEAP